ncbi:MAG: sugar ABC transporter permease [Acetatifactor sp.]|nr:sugar ABC transporter permease [Lachnospiraceae bacterium]MDE6168122.1 sugar ABC transporter permease [Acetatifactor sp.]MDE7354162.1 sugar ABC transporter permease [Acetatifactor sp.]
METIKKYANKYSHWVLLSPFLVCFVLFMILPLICGIFLSFTQYDTIQAPQFVGLKNYLTIFTRDREFMQHVLPNTIVYALIVGPGGYILSFFLAWLLSQLTKWPRTILTIIIYSPSVMGTVCQKVVWGVIFSGDRVGYLNSLLLSLKIIDEPILWLTSASYLLPIMILVGLWSSMGVGFLALVSGIMNVDAELYEAAAIDGVRKRWQEILYITIPAIKPQMLFSAVMALVNTFNSPGMGVTLSGTNPTPGYAGQLIANHMDDYGFQRYEMGYAAALSMILLLIVWVFSRAAHGLFGEKD